MGSPGGSDRPLLSQLPVSPLVSDEPAWMLSPWLHTPQQPLQSGRYLIPLGSTHHFFQENHNILTSSGAWRQECLNAPLKCQAWPPPLPACDEGFHPLEGHFVLVCSVGEYPLLQEVGRLLEAKFIEHLEATPMPPSLFLNSSSQQVTG